MRRLWCTLRRHPTKFHQHPALGPVGFVVCCPCRKLFASTHAQTITSARRFGLR